jgi:flagellar hook assembly protein FlgD
MTFTQTRTQSVTITATYTVTSTWSVSPTVTVTATPAGSNIISIDIFNDKGEKVRWLGTSLSREVVHSVVLSAKPLDANGINTTVITNSLGDIVGVWDGKDNGGRIVFPGTYFLQIKTTDKDGNDYIINVPMDVITKNSSVVDIKVEYLVSGNIRIFGDAANVERLDLKIYNIYGELVRRQPQSVSGAAYDFTWDRTVVNGSKASNGIYVVVAEFKDKRTGLVGRKIEKIAVKYGN